MLESIIYLLVGSAVFITGMNMMSSGLKKVSGKGLKTLLKKIQNSKLAGLGIGTLVTALIQSSAATSVMVIGFVSAGIMSMVQATSIMLGSFIGTTITGVLASLSTFKIATYLLSLSFIGVVLTYFKNNNVKHIGEILAGLGILFFGLETMKSAFASGSPVYVFSQSLFSSISNPILLLIVGALFTALVQSSSATSGIVIVMLTTGAMANLASGFYLVLGATVGTVITTLIATIGGNTNVKRMGFISLIIKAITASLGTLLVFIFEKPITAFFLNTFNEPGFAVAMFLVIYAVIFFSLMLPFAEPIVKLSEKVIKDKEDAGLKDSIKYIDDRMLNTPSIALMQVEREIINMLHLAYSNFELGYKRLLNQDQTSDKKLIQVEDQIDYNTKVIADFLIKLSLKVDLEDEKSVGSYFHVINDIERIGDHAYNFLESSRVMSDDELMWSDYGKAGLTQMYSVVEEMMSLSLKIFEDKDYSLLPALHELENKTDKLKTELSNAHYVRITKNECKVELTPFYSNALSELERVADHIVNIAYSIQNPVGDDE